MNHFEGLTPEQRWKNDILNELRLIRASLELQTSQFKPKDNEEGEGMKHDHSSGRRQRKSQ